MKHSIADIAVALGAKAVGDTGLMVGRAREPANAGPGDLALAMDRRYGAGLAKGQAQAAVLWDGADWQALGLKAAVFVPRARLAMAGISRVFDQGPGIAPGIHPQVSIAPDAEIGEGAAIGPFSVIGTGARIGARARIGAQVFIGDGATIGDDALVLAGARIMPRVTIGHHFICHAGAVIGADGFAFVTPEKSLVETIRETLSQVERQPPQRWVRIHSLGGVSIGDAVEIGANSTIDRGTVRDTRIGARTKLDNLVHVGHNVEIGEDCLLCAQTGISGSVRIGDRCIFGGKTGISDNIFVGDDVLAGGGSRIFTSVPEGRIVLGDPATRIEDQIATWKHIRRLGRLYRQVALLQDTVRKLTRDN